jgi:hypothetical protein
MQQITRHQITIKAEASPSQLAGRCKPATVTAHLQGDDICGGLGIVVKSPSPVLVLCRQLVQVGHDTA